MATITRRAHMSKAASQKRGSRKAEAGAPQPTKRAPQTRDLLAQRVGVSGKLIDAAFSGWKVAPEKMQGVLDGVIQCGVEAIANSGKARPGKEPKTKREPRADASGTDASNTSTQQRKDRPATSKASPPRGPEPAGGSGSETYDDVAVLEPMAALEPTVAEAVTGATRSIENTKTNAEGTSFSWVPHREGSTWGSDVRRRNAKPDRNLHRFVDAAISLLDSGESALVLIRAVRLAWLAEQNRRRLELEESRLRDGLDAFQRTMELPQEGDEVHHERSN